ncbi:MAG: hypothetical protein M1825_000551 [Sarcosagium campestre]|nr:MAG: hypothetical protein M1825_000551 [Sarcosagium campestre]
MGLSWLLGCFWFVFLRLLEFGTFTVANGSISELIEDRKRTRVIVNHLQEDLAHVREDREAVFVEFTDLKALYKKVVEERNADSEYWSNVTDNFRWSFQHRIANVEEADEKVANLTSENNRMQAELNAARRSREAVNRRLAELEAELEKKSLRTTPPPCEGCQEKVQASQALQTELQEAQKTCSDLQELHALIEREGARIVEEAVAARVAELERSMRSAPTPPCEGCEERVQAILALQKDLEEAQAMKSSRQPEDIARDEKEIARLVEEAVVARVAEQEKTVQRTSPAPCEGCGDKVQVNAALQRELQEAQTKCSQQAEAIALNEEEASRLIEEAIARRKAELEEEAQKRVTPSAAPCQGCEELSKTVEVLRGQVDDAESMESVHGDDGCRNCEEAGREVRQLREELTQALAKSSDRLATSEEMTQVVKAAQDEARNARAQEQEVKRLLEAAQTSAVEASSREEQARQQAEAAQKACQEAREGFDRAMDEGRALASAKEQLEGELRGASSRYEEELREKARLLQDTVDNAANEEMHLSNIADSERLAMRELSAEMDTVKANNSELEEKVSRFEDELAEQMGRHQEALLATRNSALEQSKMELKAVKKERLQHREASVHAESRERMWTEQFREFKISLDEITGQRDSLMKHVKELEQTGAKMMDRGQEEVQKLKAALDDKIRREQALDILRDNAIENARKRATDEAQSKAIEVARLEYKVAQLECQVSSLVVPQSTERSEKRGMDNEGQPAEERTSKRRI